jgi:hypothetical protein
MEVSPQKRLQRGCTKVRPPAYFLTIGLIANIYAGVKKGEFHITDTFIANMFRTNTRGSSPFGSNVLKDMLFGVIGMVRFHTSP